MARPSTRARCSLAQNRVMGTNSTKPRVFWENRISYYRRGALINGNPSQQRVALVTRLVVDLEDGLALVSRELRPVALPLETLPRLASTGEYRSTLTARLARSPVEAAACSLGLPPVA